MITIYFGPTPFPFAAIIGARQTGRLPATDPPSYDDLCRLPFLHTNSGTGQFIDLGADGAGSRVYSFSARSTVKMLKNLVESFLDINGISRSDYRLVPVDIKEGPAVFLGRHLLGIPLLSSLGRILIYYRIKRILGELPSSGLLD